MKPYCTHCVWHLPTVKAIREDGRGDVDVCGETLQVVRDDVGRLKFKTYGDTQRCDECGQVTQDNRRVSYQKCEVRNKGLKCSAFAPKWYLWIFFMGKKYVR